MYYCCYWLNGKKHKELAYTPAHAWTMVMAYLGSRAWLEWERL